MNCSDTTINVTLGAQRWRYAFAHGMLFLVQPGVRELVARCSSMSVAKSLAVRDAGQRADDTIGVPTIEIE